MHPPPSYCIRLEGADSTRDTEEARLEPRAAQPLPKPAQPAPDAQSAAAGGFCCCLHAQRNLTATTLLAMRLRCSIVAVLYIAHTCAESSTTDLQLLQRALMGE